MLLCKTFNCNDEEALEKDDTYLTVLLCRNIENRIFDQKFQQIMEAKRKK